MKLPFSTSFISKERVEYMAKLFPLLYAVFVIVTLFQMIIYYDAFGIEITSYLDLSEVAINFLPDMTKFIGGVFMAVYLVITTQSDFAQKKWSHQKKRRAMALLSFLPCVFFVLLISQVPSTALWLTVNYVITAGLMFATTGGFIVFRGDNKISNIPYRFITVAIVVSFIVGVLCCVTILKVGNAVKASGSFPVEITYKDRDKLRLLSDSNLVYVGKVRDYLFVYDIRKGYSTAIKMDEVESISIGKAKRRYIFWD